MPKLPGHTAFELSDAAYSLLYGPDLSKVNPNENELAALRIELKIAHMLVRVTYDRAMLQARRASPDGLSERLKAAAEAETAMGVFEKRYKNALLQIAALEAGLKACKVTKKRRRTSMKQCAPYTRLSSKRHVRLKPVGSPSRTGT